MIESKVDLGNTIRLIISTTNSEKSVPLESPCSHCPPLHLCFIGASGAFHPQGLAAAPLVPPSPKCGRSPGAARPGRACHSSGTRGPRAHRGDLGVGATCLRGQLPPWDREPRPEPPGPGASPGADDSLPPPRPGKCEWGEGERASGARSPARGEVRVGRPRPRCRRATRESRPGPEPAGP